MAEFILKPKWLAMLRATRAATARKPTPQQQSEAEFKTCDQEKERDPSHRTSDDLEDKASDDAETETLAEATGEDARTEHIPSRINDKPARENGAIGFAWKHVANKVACLAAQARDATLDVVEKVKRLDFVSTAKAIGVWAKLHPFKTALIVVPLVAIICTAVALLAAGFGPGGIVAGRTAAIIHASIGNVVAHSIFATCTSAMMGGYGSLIVFGGVWLGSTVFMLGLARAWESWKSWKSRSQRAMVLSKRGSPKPQTEGDKQAGPDVMFWTIYAAVYVVYRFKSWYRGRADGKSSMRKLKGE